MNCNTPTQPKQEKRLKTFSKSEITQYKIKVHLFHDDGDDVHAVNNQSNPWIEIENKKLHNETRRKRRSKK